MKKLGVKIFMVLSIFSVMPSSALEKRDLNKLAGVLKEKEYDDGRENSARTFKMSEEDKLVYKYVLIPASLIVSSVAMVLIKGK